MNLASPAGTCHQADRLVATIDRDVGHHDPCARLGERDGDRSPHAARSAGHQRHLAGRTLRRPSTPRFLSASTTRVRDR